MEELNSFLILLFLSLFIIFIYFRFYRSKKKAKKNIEVDNKINQHNKEIAERTGLKNGQLSIKMEGNKYWYFCKRNNIYLYIHSRYHYTENKNIALKNGWELTKTCDQHKNCQFRIPALPSFITKFIEVVGTENIESNLQKEFDNICNNYEKITQLKVIKETLTPIQQKYVKNYHPELRDYQNVGVCLLNTMQDFALFWEQRTGKTPTTILSLENKKKCIIAVPAGHEYNWLNQFKKWSSRTDVYVLKAGNIEKRKELYSAFNNASKMIMIGSYTTLANDVKFNSKKKDTYMQISPGIWEPRQFDYIVLDEAHFLRNDKTNRSVGIMTLRKHSDHAIILTATPATNKPSDIIPILQFLSQTYLAKGFLHDYFFKKEYDFVNGHFHIIRKEREKEWIELLETFGFRLELKDVIDWMPKIIESVYPIKMEDEQEKHYKLMLKEFKWGDKDNINRAQNLLEQMIRLRQISIDPIILDLPGKGNKTIWLKEYVEDNKKQNLVIWSTSTKYLKYLKQNIFKKAYMLIGEFSMEKKTKNVKNFQQTGGILLVNIQAGAEGWTFDNADAMIFVDRDWNPSKNAQANYRGMPIIKERSFKPPIEIIDLISVNSIDDYVNKSLQNKLSLTEIVNNFAKYLQDDNNLI